MRASRLVSLLLLLQARGGMTAAELAEELEVSVRTIHRDVEALGAGGVPIYADRGPHGGIRLVDGYRTRLTGMTTEEADALFLSGLPGPAAELGLGTVVAAARLKVLAALPTELRGRASRLLERFHLDAAGWFRAGESVPHLATIAQCVWDGQRIELDYERADAIVTRTSTRWASCSRPASGTSSRPTAARSAPTACRAPAASRRSPRRRDRPPGFDLATYWSESITAYERDQPRIEVTLRVRREATRWLEDVIDGSALAAAIEEPDPEPDAWRRLRGHARLAARGRRPAPGPGRRRRGHGAARAARRDRGARRRDRRPLPRARDRRPAEPRRRRRPAEPGRRGRLRRFSGNPAVVDPRVPQPRRDAGHARSPVAELALAVGLDDLGEERHREHGSPRPSGSSIPRILPSEHASIRHDWQSAPRRRRPRRPRRRGLAGSGILAVMRRVEAEALVGASRDEVWQLYDDIEGTPLWVPFVSEILYVSGPARVGTIYRERTRLGGHPDRRAVGDRRAPPPDAPGPRLGRVRDGERARSSRSTGAARAPGSTRRPSSGPGCGARSAGLHEALVAIPAGWGVRAAVNGAKRAFEGDPPR